MFHQHSPKLNSWSCLPSALSLSRPTLTVLPLTRNVTAILRHGQSETQESLTPLLPHPIDKLYYKVLISPLNVLSFFFFNTFPIVIQITAVSILGWTICIALWLVPLALLLASRPLLIPASKLFFKQWPDDLLKMIICYVPLLFKVFSLFLVPGLRTNS